MDRMNIAIALDRNVVYPAYVMIRSLAKNNSKHPICVYVLHGKLTDADLDLLRDASIIHFAGTKPWTINLIRFDIEKIWWEYAKDSPFYHGLLETIFY